MVEVSALVRGWTSSASVEELKVIMWIPGHAFFIRATIPLSGTVSDLGQVAMPKYGREIGGVQLSELMWNESERGDKQWRGAIALNR